MIFMISCHHCVVPYNTVMARHHQRESTSCHQQVKLAMTSLLLFTPMPASKKPGWVDWMKCPARAVIMEDLRPGGPLYQRDNILAEEIFAWYKQRPAFENVVIDQFKARLKDHRLMAAKDLHQALQEEQYLVQDRQLYPRQPYNERGEPKFDMHPAKLLLREDIKNKVHLTTHKASRQLQNLRP